MVETAKGMILNFLSMVKRFGFIPNGGRVYYLMRSQPPLLLSMVSKLLIIILFRVFNFILRTSKESYKVRYAHKRHCNFQVEC